MIWKMKKKSESVKKIFLKVIIRHEFLKILKGDRVAPGGLSIWTLY